MFFLPLRWTTKDSILECNFLSCWSKLSTCCCRSSNHYNEIKMERTDNVWNLMKSYHYTETMRRTDNERNLMNSNHYKGLGRTDNDSNLVILECIWWVIWKLKKQWREREILIDMLRNTPELPMITTHQVINLFGFTGSLRWCLKSMSWFKLGLMMDNFFLCQLGKITTQDFSSGQINLCLYA